MSGLVPAGHLAVEFHGERAAEGPLTFAQLDTIEWVDEARDAASALLNLTFELPDGASPADVSAAFAILLTRHESLRTTFTAAAGADDEPMQRVAASGELAIQLYEVNADLDRERATELLLEELRNQGVDYTTGLPLRVALACTDGALRAAVAVYSHMAVDFGSTAIIGRQFTELVANPAARVTGPSEHQPLDQAQDERSARGRRRSDAAIEYWRTNIAQAPQAIYALPAPAEPVTGHLTCILVSTVGASALGSIAARTRAGRHAIVLAAMCAVLSQRVEVQRLVFASISGNRFRSRLTDYVGNLAQDGLVVLDVGEDGFDELIGRTVQATFTANVHSSLDPRKLLPGLDQVGHERGTAFARDFVVNNLSVHLNVPPGEQAAIAETTIVWRPADHFPETLLYSPLQVDDILVLAFTGDTERITRDELESFAYGVEKLLVAAAEEDVPWSAIGAVTGIEPAHRDADWTCVDSCWIRAPAVRQLVLDATGTPAAEVFPGLIAYLVATESIRTPQQAHLACMSLLPERYDAMAPRHYILCNTVPEDPTDERSWQKQDVIAEGDGRVSPAAPAAAE